MHTSGRGSLMTIHPAADPIVASTPLNPAQALARELLFFELLDAGFWSARRGMLALCLPLTDAQCDEAVVAYDAFLGRHAAVLRAQLGPAA
jgi:glutamate-1-semialdehyde 2,1-aminomutase